MSPVIGTLIGPYKLLEQIGEGSVGVIFSAEQQQPVRRKVAVKFLKPGMDTRQAIARFEAERQCLAIMDHANIVRILDGGTTDSGLPYFVMELITGLPITEYCDQHGLAPRQRLELFRQVCQAVQHAHQKGIIHRDLKPFDVLVTMADATPVVKVIDFGFAKALGQKLTQKTVFVGYTPTGTPLYMSPEQAGLNNLDIDTRSDIYTLGVLLYELLTGTTPFDKVRFLTVGDEEARRITREEEPLKPSMRLSELGRSRLARAELDSIVMTCLEKDRNRRYESASDLANDIERYLHDEPVQAYPPSRWYCSRKFARRHRRVIAVMVLLGVVLLLVMIGLAISS